MNSLPADLLPYILCLLDTSDIQSCSLVAWTFHQIARPLLFSHIVLSHSTWQARCSFFLEGRGIHLLKYTTSLTCKVSGIPISDDVENIPHLLTSLLQRISQHGLQSFCIHASPPFEWSSLHHSFQDLIFSSVFPWISSLQFHWVNHILLLTVVQKCPNLEMLELSPASGSTEEGITDNEARSLSELTSLTMHMFSQSDLEKGGSLHQYITLAGTKIKSLELLSCMSLYDYPTSLEPFVSFSQQLRHLSFGSHLTDVVVRDHATTLCLPLARFQQLETLQFHISDYVTSDGDAWIIWSEWVTQLVTSKSNCPQSFQILCYIVVPDLEQRPNTMLDALAAESNFQFHICVYGFKDEVEIFKATIGSFKSAFGSWDALGKLKCWMRL